MCSGCSGHYEGDYDSQDGGADFCGGVGDERPWRAAELEANRSRSSELGRNRCYESRSDAEKRRPGEGDGYQVWVSAEHIIERRIIRANCFVYKQSEATREMEIWQESQLVREHSQDMSAKCYRTQEASTKELRVASKIGFMQLVIWGLASAMSFALALWLALG